MPVLRFDLDFIAPYRLRYHAEGDGTRRAFWLAGRPVVVQLAQEVDDGPVSAAVYSNRSLSDIEGEVRVAVARMISARDDLAEFRAAVSGDAAMAELVVSMPGLKPLRTPDLWTTLIWALIDQQLSNAAGRAIRRRFAERFGPAIEVEGALVHAVPDPETVRKANYLEIAEAGLSKRKAQYAQEIAAAVLAGDTDLEKIAALPAEQALQHLVDLRGVGMWTAEIAAIFGLGERDILPADDLGVRKAVGQIYHLPAMPEAAEVRRIGEQWAGWRSYAAVYLWYAYPRLQIAAGAR
jgi:DNA-3-methyladenine glycosylase II